MKCITISFQGKTKDCFIHDYEVYVADGAEFCVLQDENRNTLKGSWRHGMSGSKVHYEPLIYNLKTNKLVTVFGYAQGQIKDQRKYLLSL